MAGGKLTPRQKMINLMYLVLMAMLALNVSKDVLNAFVMVDDSIKKTTEIKFNQNKSLLEELQFYAKQNPVKAKPALEKAMKVMAGTDELYKYIQELKVKIVKQADGDEGDVNDIKNKEDLEAAAQVMLSPINGQANTLKSRIDKFSTEVGSYIPDPDKKNMILQSLSTKLSTKERLNNLNWQNAHFENMPAVAVNTFLSKMQNDLKNAESEALYALIKSVDVGDFRVNSLNAYVIPNSTNIIVGGTYSGRVVLSAEDSTKRPNIFVRGQQLPQASRGKFQFTCGAIGDFTMNGFIELTRGDGSISKFPFENKYSVVAPTATVSATKMNILYAGWSNPVSISVPGVPSGQLSASVSNGSIRRQGNEWIVVPNLSAIGSEVTITTSASVGGKSFSVASKFRVRKTPTPSASVVLPSGNKFKGGRVSKFDVAQSSGLIAELEDLDIPYTVVSFDLSYYGSLGDVKTLPSSGNKFSGAQVAVLEKLPKNQMAALNNIVVRGPSGTQTVNDITIISKN
jgi:gliding motility-associated protein GldM